MLEKLGDLFVKGFIGFMLIMGLAHGVAGTPEYAWLIFISLFVGFWFLADSIFYLNDIRVNRMIDRHYR